MIALSPAARMILAVLQERPLTREQIACRLDDFYSPETVRDVLNRLYRLGKIQRCGDRYELLPWSWEDAVTRAYRMEHVLVLEYD